MRPDTDSDDGDANDSADGDYLHVADILSDEDHLSEESEGSTHGC